MSSILFFLLSMIGPFRTSHRPSAAARLARFLWICGFLAILVPAAFAVDLQQQASSLRGAVESATGLSDEQKAQALKRIDETLSSRQETQAMLEQVAALRERISTAPQRIKELSARQANLPGLVATEARDRLSAEQLDAKLTERRGTLSAQQLLLEERERKLDELLSKSRTDAGDLTAATKRLAELESMPREAAEDDLVNSAEVLWRKARIELWRARIDAIKLRQGSVNLLIDVTRQERDVVAAEVEALKNNVAAMLDQLQSKRRQDAEAVVSAVERRADETPDALRAIQTEIAQLAREQSSLVAQEAELERQLQQVKRTAERLQRDYDRIQQVVELGGSSSQVSSLLQKRRQLAPAPDQLGREALTFQQQLSDAGLRQLELDEILQEAVDDEAAKTYLVNEKRIDAALLTSSSQAIGELAAIYRKTALDLWQGYTRYLNVLSQLEAATRSLVVEATRYRGFIDDRLLWVPSSELIPLTEPKLLVQGLLWFVDPQNWQVVVADMLTLPASRTLETLFWLLGVVVLFGSQRRAREGLRQAAELTRKVRTDRFTATTRALGFTLVLMLPVVWLLLGLGLLLGGLPAASNATLQVAAGLQAAGQTVLFLGIFRHLCRQEGVAVAHLQWTPVLCTQLNRQTRWLIPIAAPLAFLLANGSASVPSDFVRLAGAVQVEEAGLVSLGRLAFAAQMLFLMIIIHRIWRKNGEVMQAFADSEENARWHSYHVLWFGPALLIPLSLAVSALVGYFYTGVFLASVAGETLWFILFAVVGRDLLFRGLYVTQRRLRFQEAVRYRDELLAQRAAGKEPAAAADSPVDTVIKAIEEEKVNYVQLGEQVRSLVQLGYTISLIVGLYWIWRDIFPAFSVLNQVQLPITTTVLVDGVSQDVPLTLSALVAGLLLGGLALFAAMKVPAVLELTVLQRLPMSRASRYAFTTLLQYVVAMIGVVITFDALGLQWSSIQWLVAALSVGLGFGLQEIVANFISGIILLFEQPIRVGDVVTVDGTTGTVSKIRIRATTIVNWERQELVIPNKTFITGQLINWTLSDTVNRIFVTVGVGYGTDTRRAMELMHEVAEEHPNILTDPTHRVSFEGFGDNSLTLNMRAFLANMDNRLQTITELHQAILDKFREAGIEIAFPQRDVHLSTTEPLEFLWRRGAPPA
ncbi:MAG: mechanosensitive ion channel [Gammaproteobacteria bacterium]|nr:mechanosensitive ion channel [Gammaproteobacteria bacterium]